MVLKCDFCKSNKTDAFHITLINKLKDSRLIPQKYPNLCSKCYATYSSVINLEKFLDENDVSCTNCGKEFTHFEVLFDGRGHTAYCDCEVCGIQYTVTVASDFFAKVTEISKVVTPNMTH